MLRLALCSWSCACYVYGSMLRSPITPGNTGLDGGATVCHDADMRLTDRDARILHSLDRFGQLDAGHIWQLHFTGLKSRTSWDQVVGRLLDGKYLHRLGSRNAKGQGSGKMVYQLGVEGQRYVRKRATNRPRFSAVYEHRLAIADVYVELMAEEATGRITLLSYFTEPDCHMSLAGVTVRPDFYAVIRNNETGRQGALWVEVDRDKENRPEIERKVGDYVAVLADWENTQKALGTLPSVLFLADTEVGRNNLMSYLRSVDEAYKAYFLVDDLKGWATRLK